MADAAERFEEERRRLAAMLPGADIDRAGTTTAIEIVALVSDLDGPIAVLVERGGYALESHAPRLRHLRRGGVALTLTDDRAEYGRRAAPPQRGQV